jgi:phosphoribosylglycinamide formyltransferase 1
VIRIAVLASGEGTNLQALLDDPDIAPMVVLVASDRADARALELARATGVRPQFVDPLPHAGREAFGEALLGALTEAEIDVVALAGFMRILSADVVRSFEGRILNVHPSLLPAFPGAHAVRDALAWGVKVSGATVHLVDEEVDHGPIVVQEAVPVFPDDDEASLHRRIKEVEHRLYPLAVRLLAEGRLKVDDRVVHLLGEEGG